VRPVAGPGPSASSLALDDVDRVTDDVLAAVQPLGSAPDIPFTRFRAMGEYLRTYTDETGHPRQPRRRLLTPIVVRSPAAAERSSRPR
jgi:hypothetical protein